MVDLIISIHQIVIPTGFNQSSSRQSVMTLAIATAARPHLRGRVVAGADSHGVSHHVMSVLQLLAGLEIAA